MLRYQSVPNRPVVPVPNLSGPREQINTLGHLSKSPCNLHWYAACQFSFVTLHGLFLFLSLFPHRDKGSGKTVMWSIADWEENYDVESRWSSQTKNIFAKPFSHRFSKFRDTPVTAMKHRITGFATLCFLSRYSLLQCKRLCLPVCPSQNRIPF